MNIEQARYNMVEQQIRTWDVLNPRILELVAGAPREDYLPPAYRNLAFVDMNIPLAHSQVMMQPKIEARLLQELEIKPSEKVLEVGTGTGYLTSLLAALGKHVHSVEFHADLSHGALEQLARHNHKNVTLEVGDAANGWNRHAPYDVIVLTGSVAVLPDAFKEQLTTGGRLFAIVGNPPIMEAIMVRKTASGYAETSLFETHMPPLVNGGPKRAFVF
jgi:protein-L-isoaspartate(D-aspartate) O-methyltransferase